MVYQYFVSYKTVYTYILLRVYRNAHWIQLWPSASHRHKTSHMLEWKKLKTLSVLRHLSISEHYSWISSGFKIIKFLIYSFNENPSLDLIWLCTIVRKISQWLITPVKPEKKKNNKHLVFKGLAADITRISLERSLLIIKQVWHYMKSFLGCHNKASQT